MSRIVAPTLIEPSTSLRHAIWWTGRHWDESAPATSLRTQALAPRRLERSYAAALDTVVLARRWRCTEADASASLTDGRLLVYYPDADLADGAAEVASNGYLDVNNCPPHDTWVALLRATSRPGQPDFESHLVAWVPLAAVALVDEGIAVNPEGCIAWLDESAHLESHRLLFGDP
jgi:hypothetical protein